MPVGFRCRLPTKGSQPTGYHLAFTDHSAPADRMSGGRSKQPPLKASKGRRSAMLFCVQRNAPAAFTGAGWECGENLRYHNRMLHVGVPIARCQLAECARGHRSSFKRSSLPSRRVPCHRPPCTLSRTARGITARPTLVAPRRPPPGLQGLRLSSQVCGAPRCGIC